MCVCGLPNVFLHTQKWHLVDPVWIIFLHSSLVVNEKYAVSTKAQFSFRFHWRVLITSPSGHFVLDGRESRLFVFQISPLRHLPLSTCFPTSIWPFFLELSFPFCYNWWCHCMGLEELKLCFCHHPTFCTVSVLGVPRTQMGKCSGEVEDMYKRKDTINITITIPSPLPLPSKRLTLGQSVELQ